MVAPSPTATALPPAHLNLHNMKIQAVALPPTRPRQAQRLHQQVAEAAEEEGQLASVTYVIPIVVLAPLHLIGKSVNGHPIVVNVVKFATPPTGVNTVVGVVMAVGIAGIVA